MSDAPPPLPLPVDRTEGDINGTDARASWERVHVSPTARRLLDADAASFIHQALSTPCMNALRASSGSWIEDIDGRRYLDFHGNSAHQVGYGHPRVVEAVKRQLDEMAFCPRRYTNQPAIELAQRLGALSGGLLPRVLFAPAGTVAVSTAMKIARLATGRHKFVSMWGSFHGATLDAISLGGEDLFRTGMGTLLPGISHVPASEPSRCTLGCAGRCGSGGTKMACAEAVESALEREGGVAAVFAEPVRCTTVGIPPPGYWERIRRACDRHGALLVFDEIPTCLGRTGRMFAFEHFDVTPDILVMGKGLGGAVLPMAAVLTREGLVDGSRSALGHYTHEKTPIGAAAALATLDVIRDEGLVERSASLGRWFHSELECLKRRHRAVTDIRSLGLLMGLELFTKDDPRGSEAAERVMYACLTRGLSFKVSGGNVLTLTPPLTLSDSEAHRAIEILGAAFAEVLT